MTTLVGIREAHEQLLEELRRDTGLDRQLLSNMLQYAKCLVKEGNDIIDIVTLQFELASTFNITDEGLLCSVVEAFDECVFRTNGMSAENFVRGLGIFLCDDMEKKINMAFKVYDTKKSGELSRPAVSSMLRHSMFSGDGTLEDDADYVKDLTDLAFALCNCGEKASITKKDFIDTVHNDNLILEFMGNFFPSPHHLQIFKRSIDPHSYTPSQIREKFKNRRLELIGNFPGGVGMKPSYYPFILDLP